MVVGRDIPGERATRRIRLELIHEHGRAGHGLEGRLADEFEARRRLGHPHRGARLRRQAHQLDGLVGRDPTGDSYEQAGHGIALTSVPRLVAVGVLDLALRDLLERDAEVVLRARLDHRRRVLIESSLTEVVVVAVDLAGTLGGHENGGVVRVDVLEQRVEARVDQGSFLTSGTHMVAARPISSRAACSASALTILWRNSSWAASSSRATASRRSICSALSAPRATS